MGLFTVEEFYSYKSKFIAMPDELLKYQIFNNSKKKPSQPQQHLRSQHKNETNWLMNNKVENSEFISLLNKLSESNSDVIFSDIMKLDIQGEQCKKVIDILFIKVLNDQKFTKLYAKLCATLLDKDTFKTLLLEKTHRMFMEAINLKEHNMTYKFKDHVLNCVRFISELYNLNILTHKIIQSCYTLIFDKVKNNGMYSVEVLCVFIKSNVDKFCLNKNDGMLLFKQIESLTVVDNKDKFMLMDIIDMKQQYIKT